MKKKAALFDLDDTLVAFDAVKEASWHEVCDRYVQANPKISGVALCAAIIKHNDWFWSDELRHREGRLNIAAARRIVVELAFTELHLPKSGAELVADDYSSTRLKNMYLFSGVHETLTTLKKRKYGLALITNGESETQRSKIRRFDLERCFDFIFVESEVGYGKPDPRIYTKAVAELNSELNETWMIGNDLNWDIAGSQAIGIKAIWYDWKDKGLHASGVTIPNKRICKIAEILEILEAKNFISQHATSAEER